MKLAKDARPKLHINKLSPVSCMDVNTRTDDPKNKSIHVAIDNCPVLLFLKLT